MDTRSAGHELNLELSKKREQAFRLRIKIQESHSQVKAKIRHFDDSRESFMALFATGPVELDTDTVRHADVQLRSDSDALKAALDQLRNLNSQLSVLDYDLFNQERTHQIGSNFIEEVLKSGQVEAETIESKTVVPVIKQDDNQLPPLLEEYFDTLGDVKNTRERLEYDMPLEHAERLRERERRVDQDDKLSTTDSEFELSMQRERKDVQMGLKSLNDRAKELLSKCLAEGLDPDPMKYVRKSDYESSAGQNRTKVEQWLGDQGENTGYLEVGDPGDEYAWSDQMTLDGLPSQNVDTQIHTTSKIGAADPEAASNLSGKDSDGSKSSHDSKMENLRRSDS